ncbi:dipeptidyl peptidase 3 [Reichenbachiella agariperforans]|uniref:dipeptidyl peptidase 3 n=1 Tax=Reichenbachiella agariperforans TaxID=156994 RepID=UPI001C09B714|nr:dipeptidyl peptidase 3 [Reichenbachiella agariperforans]MBU2913106.1 dipeptidyl peptidase 3 [Reichenbachiella agariperforans]
MKTLFIWLVLLVSTLACQQQDVPQSTSEDDFEYSTEQFADLKIYRYRIPNFDELKLNQKKLVYYLAQAGLSGRDIIYDQNYRHNLTIRKALENIVSNYTGDRSDANWAQLMEYTKRVWFSNGIHHHYSMAKIIPEFSPEYFDTLLHATNQELSDEVLDAIFDPSVDNKKVNLDESKGLLLGSATNFYDPDVTADEVEQYYSQIINKNTDQPLSYGLNAKLVKNEDGQLEEIVWKSNGLYGTAIDQIIYWLDKATTVAENDAQKKALELLISYYQTGDLKIWDDYNVAWTSATEGDIDYINSFIEVYNDPLGYRGSFESIVQIKDFEASDRMQVLSDNAQWFEDNSPIMDEHKKSNVVGVSYKVVNVASESGDASPSTPIGVNLPNANWIRSQHGSKSVSLGNIIDAYKKGSSGGMTEEFTFSKEEAARAEKYGVLGDKMHTALHEVIGHASGQINPGVGTPKETLKNYASTLEEGRADLVGLYFIMDPKLVELGLILSQEVGMEEYDSYIRNGMLAQLRRIEPGESIEEAHMRNRAWVSNWSYEQGLTDNVIEKVMRDNKTYYVIHDYEKLREIFGQLLRETQRIKSEGDYQAAKDLVENYGVKVDPVIHSEILARTEKLDIAPYGGFINPLLVPNADSDGNITDITIEYPEDFTEQMLYYAKKYSFL